MQTCAPHPAPPGKTGARRLTHPCAAGLAQVRRPASPVLSEPTQRQVWHPRGQVSAAGSSIPPTPYLAGRRSGRRAMALASSHGSATCAHACTRPPPRAHPTAAGLLRAAHPSTAAPCAASHRLGAPRAARPHRWPCESAASCEHLQFIAAATARPPDRNKCAPASQSLRAQACCAIPDLSDVSRGFFGSSANTFQADSDSNPARSKLRLLHFCFSPRPRLRRSFFCAQRPLRPCQSGQQDPMLA